MQVSNALFISFNLIQNVFSNIDGTSPVTTTLPVGNSVMTIPTAAGNIQISISAVPLGAPTSI